MAPLASTINSFLFKDRDAPLLSNVAYYASDYNATKAMRFLACVDPKFWSRPGAYEVRTSQDAPFKSDQWYEGKQEKCTVGVLSLCNSERKEAKKAAMKAFESKVLFLNQETEAQEQEAMARTKEDAALAMALSHELNVSPCIVRFLIETKQLGSTEHRRCVVDQFYSDRERMGPNDFLFVGARYLPDYAHCTHWIASSFGDRPETLRDLALQQHVKLCLRKVWDAKSEERTQLEMEYRQVQPVPWCTGQEPIAVPRSRVGHAFWAKNHPFFKQYPYQHPLAVWYDLESVCPTKMREHLPAEWIYVYRQINQLMRSCSNYQSAFPLSVPEPAEWPGTAELKASYDQVLSLARRRVGLRRFKYSNNNYSDLFWSHMQEWNLSELLMFLIQAVPIRLPLTYNRAWTKTVVPWSDAIGHPWARVHQRMLNHAFAILSRMTLVAIYKPTKRADGKTKELVNRVLYIQVNKTMGESLGTQLQNANVAYKMLQTLPLALLVESKAQSDSADKTSYRGRYGWYAALEVPQWNLPKERCDRWMEIDGASDIMTFTKLMVALTHFPPDTLLDFSLSVEIVQNKHK